MSVRTTGIWLLLHFNQYRK